MNWISRLRSFVPSRETLESSPWLAWLAPWLGHPKLWHWSRRGVALGVAVGLFFGLLLPLAQIPAATSAAIVLRANLPAAAASTLVTNPLTFAPIYYGAYRLGVWMTGEEASPLELSGLRQAISSAGGSFLERLAAIGKPLLVGLFTISVIAGLMTFYLIKIVWYWGVILKRRTSSSNLQV